MSLSKTALPADTSLPVIHKKTSGTVGYFVVFITLGLVTASLGPTLPDLAANTQTRLGEISFLFFARSLGYLVGSLLGGRLYDRWSGHPIMVVMLIGMAVLMTLIPLVPLLGLLTLVLFALGMVEATVDVGGNTLLVWTHRHEVGPFMNGLHFFFGVGAFLSPIIIAQAVLLSGDITWAYWILAMLILPVAAWMVRIPSPPAQKVSKEHRIGEVNHLLVALSAIFLLLYVGAEVSAAGWIFSYATALDLTTETMARYLTSAFWGSFTVGRLLAIPIAARFRPRTILLADLLGSMACLSLIVVWPHSAVALWVGILGFGFSMASIFPTTLSLLERRVTVTGQVTGWIFAGASAGAMSVPWLIGQLFEPIGPRVVMTAILVALICAAVVFFALIGYSNRFLVAESVVTRNDLD